MPHSAPHTAVDYHDDDLDDDLRDDPESDDHVGGFRASSLDVVTAFRRCMATRLVELRQAAGLTPDEAARKLTVSVSLLERWETGSLVPKLSRLRRLCDIYQVELLTVLEEVVDQVRPRGLTHLPVHAEAIMLHMGLAPEEALDGDPTGLTSSLLITDAPPPHPDWAALPDGPELGELLRYTRDNNPARRRGALKLRHIYETMPSGNRSIRAVSEQVGLYFGTTRTLLQEAGTIFGHGEPPADTSVWILAPDTPLPDDRLLGELLRRSRRHPGTRRRIAERLRELQLTAPPADRHAIQAIASTTGIPRHVVTALLHELDTDSEFWPADHDLPEGPDLGALYLRLPRSEQATRHRITAALRALYEAPPPGERSVRIVCETVGLSYPTVHKLLLTAGAVLGRPGRAARPTPPQPDPTRVTVPTTTPL